MDAQVLAAEKPDALAASAPLIPPAPKVHAKDLKNLGAAWAMMRNMIGAWSESGFDTLMIPYRFLGQPGLVVSDPAGVRHVLGAGAARYRRPYQMSRILRPIVGDGLLLTDGETWRRQRKALAPAFTPKAVETLLPHFIAAGQALTDGLADHDRANLSETFHRATLDAVLRALFSRSALGEGAHLAQIARDYLQGRANVNLFDLLARGPDDFGFAERPRRIQGARWMAAVGALIDERKTAEPQRQGGDLLDSLLAARDEDGQALPDIEVRDQCGTMLAAGFETTSRLLFWAAYLLALDPKTQTRIRAEILAFPPDKIRTLDDLSAWPLTRSVLLETLRLYPPAPTMSREAIAEDEVQGHRVSPGDVITISPWLIHRHRKLWDQPTAFLPERFLNHSSPWGVDAFIPFGAGARICIGASFAMAESQILLGSLLSQFKVAMADDRPVVPVAKISLGPDREPDFTLTPITQTRP
ncbi:cytochrome P450 [Caulobacter sp. SL161]|uniref:cytochrome P450 n=1 Tax=Caulobacter sp. SL161 TaxID=2995156 RepID=UPI0022733918|nr:cytochrome P450 [Caulobacter sp. SL161]MCY1648894.1 cytochrome P450 [Caulobacter sp. SL161]